MKKLLIMGVMSLALMATNSALAVLTNGSFETGDLTGWTTVLPVGASASAVTSHNDPIGTGTTSWGPTDGNYFALLTTDGPGSVSQMYQSFYADAGDNLSFDYFWDSGDYVPFNDMTSGVLLSGVGTGGLVVTSFFWHSVNGDPANFWGTDWQTVNYTIPVSGDYTLLFSITNSGDSIFDSRMGVDNVSIPAPGAILLGSIGAGLVGWLRRRKTL